MQNNHITIVAGFGRCGSSLVMQMLAAGGMPTPYSSYPSYEIEIGQKMNVNLLKGGAMKVLDIHLKTIPHGPDYQFIWLDRDPMEQAKSMAKLLETIHPHLPPLTKDGWNRLAESIKKDRPKAIAKMHGMSQRVLKLRFEDILANSERAARTLSIFCGGALVKAAMVDIVVKRGPGCLPYLLELEQLAAMEAE